MYTPIIPLNYDVVYSCDAYDEVRENSLCFYIDGKYPAPSLAQYAAHTTIKQLLEVVYSRHSSYFADTSRVLEGSGIQLESSCEAKRNEISDSGMVYIGAGHLGGRGINISPIRFSNNLQVFELSLFLEVYRALALRVAASSYFNSATSMIQQSPYVVIALLWKEALYDITNSTRINLSDHLLYHSTDSYLSVKVQGYPVNILYNARYNSLSISCSPSLRDTFKAYGITAELL